MVTLGGFVDFEADEFAIGHHYSLGVRGPASGDNLADLGFGFFDLLPATDIPCTGIGERAARGADRQEVVQDDTAPFDAVGIEQDAAAGTAGLVQFQPVRQTRWWKPAW